MTSPARAVSILSRVGAESGLSAEVLAVIVAIIDGEPCALTLTGPLRLPAGPLLPGHRSLQAATRTWVEEQTGRQLGFLEQLYTFADLGRDKAGHRHLSISYLGLTRDDAAATALGGWTPWYSIFPWEDRRGAPLDLSERLRAWADCDPARAESRRLRCAITFGLDGRAWQPDLALQRYELLYEAGLVPESPEARPETDLAPGRRMLGDHRRVLATGMARLRATIQYRPVVFELLGASFTLRELQTCVEALAGRPVHTQNFRRLIDQQHLVEETGAQTGTGGRPARLYRFRRAVLDERLAAGTKLPTVRAR